MVGSGAWLSEEDQKAPLVLTDQERQTLQRWSRRSKTSQALTGLHKTQGESVRDYMYWA